MRPDDETLRQLLASGILAPSAENRHYLRFEVCSDGVDLIATDQASWAAQSHRRLLALLSYGAVIENLALRSVQLGHSMTATLLTDPSRPDRMASLTWTATTALPDPLCHAISVRHTNRRFYRRHLLAAKTLVRLSAAAQSVPGADVLWLDDVPARSLALQAIRLAETERFRQRALHDELFGAVRFDLGWHASADEWLPPGALEIELPMRLPFAWLRHWSIMRIANRFGLHAALGLRAGYLPCALAPHIGLIVADPQGTDCAALQAGRAFQRLWLAATALGLSLQPMAAATALACQTAGEGWVSASVRSRLRHLLDDLSRGHDAQPFMLFRLGQAKEPTVVTGRMPLHHYMP